MNSSTSPATSARCMYVLEGHSTARPAGRVATIDFASLSAWRTSLEA